ncbi:uncharacterized protein LOC123703567 [Colias croceus]|uniref:uncharacterized protein LOC123703567 n=1 Tax=Colias crocea TaxID=72248 RepID=UPI001E27D987|nr:uncharacterized protein LOC123703567 [Colias croceus]XP_045507596.1 uncharacterized protein LOC123703567 [Colias croceus]
MNDFTKIVLSSPRVGPKQDYEKIFTITEKLLSAAAKYGKKRAKDNDAPIETDASNLMHTMTGEPLEVCELFVNGFKLVRTFTDWYRDHDRRRLLTHQDHRDELILRHIFIHHYVHLHRIPTVEIMLGCLEEHFGHSYNLDSLTQLLQRNGYIWKRVKGTSKSIVMEDPRKRYERRKYLDTILEMRKNKSHFVYIDDTIFIANDCSTSEERAENLYCYAAVSPTLGLLNSACMPLTKEISKVIKVPTENFILEKVIYEIPQASVIVIPERSYHAEPFLVVPNVHSSKEQMQAWLLHHDVPHTSDMHSAQLLQLVQRSKRHAQTDLRKFDITLSTYGHKVVRLPRQTSYLYYFQQFWTEFKQLRSATTNDWKDVVPEALKRVSNKSWLEMESNLAALEQKVIEEDEALENILDKIQMMARDGLAKSKVTECDEIDSDEWLHEVIFP